MWRKKKVGRTSDLFKPYRTATDSVNSMNLSQRGKTSVHNASVSDTVHPRSASSLLIQRRCGYNDLQRSQDSVPLKENQIHHTGYFLQDNHTPFDRAFAMGIEQDHSPSSRCRASFNEMNNESPRSALSILNVLSDKRKRCCVPSTNTEAKTFRLLNTEEEDNDWDKNFRHRLSYSDSSPTTSFKSFNNSCSPEELGSLKYFPDPYDSAFQTSNPKKMVESPQNFILPIHQSRTEFNLKINEDNDCTMKINCSIPSSPHTPICTNVKTEENPYFHHSEKQFVKETQASEDNDGDSYIPDDLSECPLPNSPHATSSTLMSDDLVRKDMQIQVLQPCITDPDQELLKWQNQERDNLVTDFNSMNYLSSYQQSQHRTI